MFPERSHSAGLLQRYLGEVQFHVVEVHGQLVLAGQLGDVGEVVHPLGEL